MFLGLLDAFHDPLILFDKDRKVLWGNENASRLLARDVSPLVGRTCEEICGGEDSAMNGLIEVCFKTGHPGKSRATNQNVVDLRTFPVFRDERRDVSHVILTATDVSEKSAFQEQAMKTSRLATLGVLSAGIAHEINNPNTTILFNGSLLEDVWREIEPILRSNPPKEGTVDFGALSYLDVLDQVPILLSDISNCSRRIQRIVAQLKFLVRKSDEKIDQPVDMEAIIQDAVGLLHNKILKLTDRLTLNLEKNTPKGIGNAQQLEQVFSA